MEPTYIDTIIKSLGLDPVQVGQWTTLLFAWRMVFKIGSGKIQEILENAIKKAQESGDGRIINWIAKIVQALPYRILAWIIDTIFSVKLPLNIKTQNSAQTGP